MAYLVDAATTILNFRKAYSDIRTAYSHRQTSENLCESLAYLADVES